MNHSLVIELAKESGLLFNTEMIKGEAYGWHKQKIYHFVELLLKHQDSVYNTDKQLA